MSNTPPATDRPEGSIGELGEFAVIDRITAGTTMTGSVELGPGDDAAVVTTPDGRVVISVDMLVDGVHFRSDWAGHEQIGRRAALAAMSDIAAMGAVPTGLVVAVAAPPSLPAERMLELGRGLSAAAAEAGAALVGGDLTRADALSLAVTVIGDLRGVRPVRRSGARAGDVVAVTGRLGWAAAGLTVLSRGFRSPAALVNAYRVPEPPLAAGPVAAASGATSMVDVSDGLLADLGHVAHASGVAINIRSASLQVHPRLVEVAAALGRDPLDWVLTGGDDHALAATFPHGATLPPGWEAIGSVGVPGDLGPVVTVDGAVREGAGGWDHFG
ncbi:thiamine-phosphate kinase [Nakamurella endophytica]|uniref:Thiamine-monophosphate kinase n=1 Tax=Nakamurella endophytica TaxID=1748367 RepID=A0A917WAQ0_9ACTN|nr:thiamine-phosphate kinase [Nakamurella endophytica]GGL84940.1 thiamine-monophosphate kinase [Nakamurella endophytica]